MPQIAASYHDESVPLVPYAGRKHPLVVFGDHRFCAGESLAVQRMPGPHMHSQIELNFVLEGGMTYWFDGRRLAVSAGRLVLFWGMIPHQVTDCTEPTHFVCLYVPMSVFLGLSALSSLRGAIFRGAMIEALGVQQWEPEIFRRWRAELLSGDQQALQIVKDELTARIRRLDREGWHDLREGSPGEEVAARSDAARIASVETMTRFIGERGLDPITVEDVAEAAGLHPNYAMTLYRRSVGMTIKQSILRHRLDTAQSMLIASDMAVAFIAFDCGFNSLSAFYAAFEQRFRTSPAAFRKRFAAKVG